MTSKVVHLSDRRHATDQRMLIAALDDQTLLGVAKLGHPEERRIAQAELARRDGREDRSVMGAADRLIGACDELDLLLAGGDPADDLIWDRLLGEGRM